MQVGRSDVRVWYKPGAYDVLYLVQRGQRDDQHIESPASTAPQGVKLGMSHKL